MQVIEADMSSCWKRFWRSAASPSRLCTLFSQPKLSVDDIIERRKKSRPEVRLPSPDQDEDADDESAANDLSEAEEDGEDGELEFHGFNDDEDDEMDSGDDEGES